MADDRDRRDRPERLELSPERMRELGYRVIDRIVDHLEHLDERPAIRRGGRSELEALLREPLPEAGIAPEAALEGLERDVFRYTGQVQHPRFFAFVPSPSNFVAVLADALVAGFNPFAGTWFAGSGPLQVELVTIDWLRAICGLPEGSGGLFVSGGSMANLTALAAARHARLDGHHMGSERGRRLTVYLSDQTHSAVLRGLRVLGFGDDQLRVLPGDDGFRLSVDALATAIATDRKAGREPFCVVANAGTTNTGAVDRLDDLAALCRHEELWLHADGAYGAAAALAPRGRALLAGLGEVDSLALDPHKWLFQPFEIGCVILRRPVLLRRAFSVRPEYLRDVERPDEEVNLADYGVQLTRSARALKLYLTFRIFGAAALRAAVERGFELAERAETLLREDGCWEIVHPATMAIVCFRYAPAGVGDEILNRVHDRIVDRIVDDGSMVATTTVLRGRTVLRLCTINPRTTGDDLRAVVTRLRQLAEELVER